MKTQINYEWCYEITDEHGDIIDSDFADSLQDFGQDREGELVLVRNEGNEDEGVTDRFWAYVKDGKLPDYFSDSMGGQIGIKVPEKYKTELSRYQNL